MKYKTSYTAKKSKGQENETKASAVGQSLSGWAWNPRLKSSIPCEQTHDYSEKRGGGGNDPSPLQNIVNRSPRVPETNDVEKRETAPGR